MTNDYIEDKEVTWNVFDIAVYSTITTPISTNAHPAVVFSPLNTLLPTLKLRQVGGTKITNKILGLNLGNCLVLYQNALSASQDKNSEFQCSGENLI